MKSNLEFSSWAALAAVALMFVAALFVQPGTLRAQSAASTGQIVGEVVDPSGGAVAGAEVTVRNTGTNYIRTVTTDAAGRYVAPYLPLGMYEIGAKASGFGESK